MEQRSQKRKRMEEQGEQAANDENIIVEPDIDPELMDPCHLLAEAIDDNVSTKQLRCSP